MKTKTVLLSMLVALCLGACSSNNDDWLTGIAPESPEQAETRHSYKPVQLNETQLAINAKLQEFSWSLFKEVYMNRDEGTNLMISPISLEVDLGMFINGLEGETLQEVLKTMGLESYTKEQINDYFKTMMTGIEKADEAAIFKSANSFWYNKNKTANKDFLSVIQNNYDAKTEAVDFSDNKTKDIINDWCAEKTNGRIPIMIGQTNPLDLFHLMNAVYFKAQWQLPFVKSVTTKQPFHYANGTTTDVELMHTRFFTSYAETDKFQQCIKPFVDNSFQMVFILPKEGVKMEDAIPEALDCKLSATAEVYPGKPEAKEVDLYVPKFTSKYTENNLFAYMENINPSFSFKVEDLKFFDDPVNDNSMVSALQKTFILVDETGAEAAAVTDIVLNGASGIKLETVEMRLDHPFIYAIIESNTQCPLFIGYYGN